MCAQYQLIAVTAGRQLLLLLFCSNEEIDSRRYEIWSIFSFQNVHS